jgi:preprotein translocase subunit YajC
MGNAFWTALIFSAEGAPGGGLLMFWPLIAIVFLFWFLLLRPEQQRRKQHEAMLRALKKNDRVIAAGGIYGVVTDVDREADEVTIRVDETAKVKLRVTYGSVARVLVDKSSDESSSK